jgi:hypothetical protein
VEWFFGSNQLKIKRCLDRGVVEQLIHLNVD